MTDRANIDENAMCSAISHKGELFIRKQRKISKSFYFTVKERKKKKPE